MPHVVQYAGGVEAAVKQCRQQTCSAGGHATGVLGPITG